MDNIASYAGLGSILFLVIGVIFWLQLVQTAFEERGFIWGLWSIFFPIGTYRFCKLKWEDYGEPFWKMSICIGAGLILYLVSIMLQVAQ